jgi:hypothetical protein
MATSGFLDEEQSYNQAFHLLDMFRDDIESAVMRFNATSIA